MSSGTARAPGISTRVARRSCTYGAPAGIGQRQLTHNVNFFMNVPVTSGGDLMFDDGLSAPGRYVELTASRDILVLISNCPQVNNPCNGWNPTPIQLLGWW